MTIENRLLSSTKYVSASVLAPLSSVLDGIIARIDDKCDVKPRRMSGDISPSAPEGAD